MSSARSGDLRPAPPTAPWRTLAERRAHALADIERHIARLGPYIEEDDDVRAAQRALIDIALWLRDPYNRPDELEADWTYMPEHILPRDNRKMNEIRGRHTIYVLDRAAMTPERYYAKALDDVERMAEEVAQSADRDVAALGRRERLWAPALGRRLVHAIGGYGPTIAGLAERARALPGVVVVDLDDLRAATAERLEALAVEAAAAAPEGSTVLFVNLPLIALNEPPVRLGRAKLYVLDVPIREIFRQVFTRIAERVLGEPAFVDTLYASANKMFCPKQVRDYLDYVETWAARMGAERAGADAVLAALE